MVAPSFFFKMLAVTSVLPLPTCSLCLRETHQLRALVSLPLALAQLPVLMAKVSNLHFPELVKVVVIGECVGRGNKKEFCWLPFL